MAVILEEHCVLLPILTFFGSSILISLVDKSQPIKCVVFPFLNIFFLNHKYIKETILKLFLLE